MRTGGPVPGAKLRADPVVVIEPGEFGPGDPGEGDLSELRRAGGGAEAHRGGRLRRLDRELSAAGRVEGEGDNLWRGRP